MKTITRWTQFAPSHKADGHMVFGMAMAQAARNTFTTREQAFKELADWKQDDRWRRAMELALGCPMDEVVVGPVECEPRTNDPITRWWMPYDNPTPNPTNR